MREIGKKLSKDLEAAGEVHISSVSGTDLWLRLDERPVLVEDGIIDEEDVERGLISTYLPAGCLVVAPLEDSAEGKVVFDLPNHIWGEIVEGLQWIFEKGKLISWKAAKGSKSFEKILEGMSGDKDRIGLLMIGLNPAYKPGYPLSEIALGTISIGIGNNERFGGKNKGTGVFTAYMSSGTIEIDGKRIMTDGKLAYQF
jgi:leucyl aminopeptidase (aminopeptidase T)